MSALSLFQAAQAAAALLPSTAFITLSARADEATVREFAALSGGKFTSHMTVWPPKRKQPPSVIYSAEVTINGVRIGIQGSRDATIADATDGASSYFESIDIPPADAAAALAVKP